MVKWIPRSIMCWGAKCSREERVLSSKVFQGAKCVKEQSVLRSKVFQGEKCVKEQSVLRSKVFQGAKGVEKHSVLRSKVFWDAKSVEEQGVMRSKGFWVAKGVKEQGVLRSKLWLCQVCWAAKCVQLLRSKMFLRSKCSLVQSVPQPEFRKASKKVSLGKNISCLITPPPFFDDKWPHIFALTLTFC